jgi:hypothetical protein
MAAHLQATWAAARAEPEIPACIPFSDWADGRSDVFWFLGPQASVVDWPYLVSVPQTTSLVAGASARSDRAPAAFSSEWWR